MVQKPVFLSSYFYFERELKLAKTRLHFILFLLERGQGFKQPKQYIDKYEAVF